MRWSASCILSVPSLFPIIVMNYSPVRRNLKWCEIDHTILTCWCHDDTRALGFYRSHRIFPVRCSHKRQSLNRENNWSSARVRTLHIYVYYFNTCTVHFYYFVLWPTNAQLQLIITLLHVSTLSCHLQGTRNQYLAKLHKYCKCRCW